VLKSLHFPKNNIMETVPGPKRQKWLVVFLIYADFTVQNSNDPTIRIEEDIKVGLNQLLKDIMVTAIDPEVCRVHLIMDRLTFYKNKNVYKLREQMVQFEIGNLGKDPFNQITKISLLESGEGKFVSVSEELFENHKHDFQRATQLAEILCKIDVAEDEEILLVTWDHGSGYGIFSEETTSVEPYALDLDKFKYINHFWKSIYNEKGAAIECEGRKQWKQTGWVFEDQGPVIEAPGEKLTEAEKLQKQKQNAIVTRPVDKQDGDVLTSSELAEALSRWFDHSDNHSNSKKIGVLAMMNCFMMNMHSMHNFSETVECLVATQTAITNPGYNIEAVLQEINSQLEGECLSPQRLASILVDSSTGQSGCQRAAAMGLVPDETINCWALFAADLQRKNADGDRWFELYRQKIEQVLSKIYGLYLRNQANETRKDGNTALLYLLKYSRSVTYDFGQGNALIDAVNWLDTLAKLDTLNPPHQRIIDPGTFQVIARLKMINQAQLKNASPMLTPLNKKFRYRADAKNTIMGLPTGFGMFFPDCAQSQARWEKFEAVAKSDGLLQTPVFKSWKELLLNGYASLAAPQGAQGPERVNGQSQSPTIVRHNVNGKQQIQFKLGELNMTIDVPNGIHV
jgi:hypothetical protein